jgi:hypothetical protein
LGVRHEQLALVQPYPDTTDTRCGIRHFARGRRWLGILHSASQPLRKRSISAFTCGFSSLPGNLHVDTVLEETPTRAETKMIRRIILTLAFLCSVLSPFADSARSQTPGGPPDASVYVAVGHFFNALLHAADPIIPTIDKARFARDIRSLGNDFETMITEKVSIASLLKDNPLNVTLIDSTARQLERDVRLSVDRITNISFLLKENYQAQGQTIAKDLRTTLLEGKSWLRELIVSGLPKEPNDLTADWSRDAKASANALDQANAELAKLIVETDK